MRITFSLTRKERQRKEDSPKSPTISFGWKVPTTNDWSLTSGAMRSFPNSRIIFNFLSIEFCLTFQSKKVLPIRITLKQRSVVVLPQPEQLSSYVVLFCLIILGLPSKQVHLLAIRPVSWITWLFFVHETTSASLWTFTLTWWSGQPFLKTLHRSVKSHIAHAWA